MNHLRIPSRRARQAGFTLVEMMVAIGIGLVVLMGMTVTFVNLKNTFRSQDKLGQLQDNERLALTILSTAINEAGYYPFPKSGSTIAGGNAPSSSPVSPGGTMPNAAIFGTASGGTATTPESLQTQYASISTDGLISCIGTSYAGSATVPATVRNIFYVDPTTQELKCRVLVNNGTGDAMSNDGTKSFPLVSGIRSMSVLYGITTSADSQVNHYVPVGGVTDWTLVKSARITLNFVNPFDSTATIARTHTINLMN